MPEEYTSVFEPERPPPPPKPKAKPRLEPNPKLKPEPQYVPEEYIAPPVAPPRPVVRYQEPPVAQPKPAPIAPDNVFDLFNQPEVKKVEEPVDPFLMNPSVPISIPEQAHALAPVQDDTTTKLNNILKQIQMREEENKRQKEEETKRMAEMQAQFATRYAMNPMMPMMNPMGYMTNPMFRGNPYMTGYPGMQQRPQAPGTMPYQVKSLFND
jgi:hypothetical protein